MDELERRIRAARPVSGNRTLPLTDRAKRELAELIRSEVKDPRVGMVSITDVEVIYVEGLAFGPEAAEKSVAAAVARASELAQAA